MFGWLSDLLSSKKTLEVTVNTSVGADPAVSIDDRDAYVAGRRVRWERAAASPEFDFEDLDLNTLGFPGQKISKKKQRLSCKNSNIEEEYEYTITVRAGGKLYTSDLAEGGDGEGGKPVIRNKN